MVKKGNGSRLFQRLGKLVTRRVKTELEAGVVAGRTVGIAWAVGGGSFFVLLRG